ncbi:MAG: bifunctional phosphopantothenoylcysteine decarboxylase/phosphopantothenate--cysteine ligase CoaBC [Gemmatimonadota bacterium]|nr:bifunctional phosphopantothenoylcysteine decarboxylase/phosphopantothenate--cysteine ligase CoaBC [Gemmatimonadota bacterium]
MPAAILTPCRPWTGRRVVLGVTGGVAAYKSIQVARDLTRLGATVDAVLTSAAQRFVTPLAYEAVTGRPALTDLFSADGAALHVRLGQEADVVCVAPAGADFLSRAASGRANDLICTTLLATRAPVVICPAMNERMFSHPQVQRNLDHLKQVLGYEVAGPGLGPLAAGEGEGHGRLIEPWQIEEAIGRALTPRGRLAGRRVLVTAGPTRESLDPVRFLGNRSSGRMGYAMAQVAWRRGGQVTLVSGPSELDDPFGVDVVRVETAEEMLAAVTKHASEADVLVFAAAVADYRPVDPSARKVKRAEAGPELGIVMVENPDVAVESLRARKAGSVAVGFALETDDVLANAEKKLTKKGFDLVVANDATEEGAGFGVETNRVTILDAEGGREDLPLLSKSETAEEVWDRAESRLAPEVGRA